jgi:hypothetical protein
MAKTLMRLQEIVLAGVVGCASCTCADEPNARRGVEGDSKNAAAVHKRRVREGWYASPSPEPDPPVVDYDRLDSGIPPLPPRTPAGDPRLARSLFDPPVTVTSTKWDLNLEPTGSHERK